MGIEIGHTSATLAIVLLKYSLSNVAPVSDTQQFFYHLEKEKSRVHKTHECR